MVEKKNKENHVEVRSWNGAELFYIRERDREKKLYSCFKDLPKISMLLEIVEIFVDRLISMKKVFGLFRFKT